MDDARTLACHCNALRQGARQVTQFYDRHLAPSGLRISQYALLKGLARLGPISINGLADAMVMDRTTLGRGLRPSSATASWRSGRGRTGARAP